jgi:hypothetical protein
MTEDVALTQRRNNPTSPCFIHDGKANPLSCGTAEDRL